MTGRGRSGSPGVVRSIQSENSFRKLPEDIAAEPHVSVSGFIATLYDEMCALRAEVRSFTSALCRSCRIDLDSRAAMPAATPASTRAAVREGA